MGSIPLTEYFPFRVLTPLLSHRRAGQREYGRRYAHGHGRWSLALMAALNDRVGSRIFGA